MKTLSVGLACALALTSFGCATDRDGDGDGTGSGSGSGSGEPPPPTPPRTLDLTGTYRVHSTYDIADAVPGTAGSILGGLIDATDSPNDPMAWVLDQVIAQVGDPTAQTILSAAATLVAGDLNAQLIDLAPGLVNGLLDLGDKLAAVTQKFGVEERFEIGVTVGDAALSNKVTADGLRFTLDGVTKDFLFASYNLDDVIVPGVPVSLQNTSVTIGRHALPLEYGTVVRIALDEVVIPSIAPGSNSIGELLNSLVDCQAVGASISSSLGFGGPALWAGACIAGLNALAEPIYDQIAAIDQQLIIDASGTCRAVDTNTDYKVDRLEVGVWTGTATFDGAGGALGISTFNGTRLELP